MRYFKAKSFVPLLYFQQNLYDLMLIIIKFNWKTHDYLFLFRHIPCGKAESIILPGYNVQSYVVINSSLDNEIFV